MRVFECYDSPDLIHFELPQSRKFLASDMAPKRKIVASEDRENSISMKTSELIPVDAECGVKDSHHVYCENGVAYHATLNQTNLQNNNNKFYIMQLLKHDKKKSFCVYFRWGRVGVRGQDSLVKASNVEEAQKVFEKKFRDKTSNLWMDTNEGHFEKVPGKYDFLRMDFKPEEDVKPIELGESKLDEKIQSLLNLICDKKVMESIMKEMLYDSKKTPLGKLTVQQIKDGYVALQKLAVAIKSQKKGSDIVNACNEFYTKIPHSFGMKVPPLLKTQEDVAEKINMLEALENIRVAMEVMDEKNTKNLHPLDKYYNSMQCEMTALDHSSEEFKVINEIVAGTHGPTHKYNLKVIEIYKCFKENEHKNFKNKGKSYLLWHGSRISNWLGILKKGLQIAPPEAPVTGYMFGKGIYFADVCTKSANYCNINSKEKEGLLTLSEVCVGNPLELISCEDLPRKIPKEFHSVKGVGRHHPSVSEKTVLSSEADAFFGPLVEDNEKQYDLIYNEYVVYDVNQVKLKYLVRVQVDKYLP